MNTLLEIKASLFSDGGNSSKLANSYVQRWQAAHPDGKVVVRDLALTPVTHLGAATVGAFFTPAEQRTPEQEAAVAESDALIAELKAADVVVIGMPMYNFQVPSTLKAYFDHIARAGVTFRYTANGPEGLLKDRKVMIFTARGGIYRGTPADSQTPYVQNFLNFLGLRDLHFVYAEGMNLGEEAKASSLAKAGNEIEALEI